MTAVVAYTDGNTVYMGADSLATNEMFSKAVLKHPKIFRKGEMLIGYCHSFRMGQIVDYLVHVKDPTTQEDVFSWLVTVFVPELKRVMEENDALDDKGKLDGVLLVGIRGRLIRIEDDFSVFEVEDDFDAIGVAEDICRGAMYIRTNTPGSPKQWIRDSLSAAEHFNASVGKPFAVLIAPEVLPDPV